MNKTYDFRIIGQRENVKKLEFLLSAYKQSSVMPHILFSGAKGVGKSLIAKELGRNMYLVDKQKNSKKVFIELLASAIKTPDDLMQKVLLQYETAILFIDEIHSLNKNITTFLLPLLAPNKKHYNEINYGNGKYRFDFKKISVIGATSEPHLLFKPLADRFFQIELTDYNQSELAAIIAQNINPEFNIDQETLYDLASYGRGNGRHAYSLAENGVNSYLLGKNKKEFTKKDLKELIIILDIFPKGLSRYEANVLRLIGAVESSSLNALCSKTGMSKPALMLVETQLMRHNLLEITGKRKITGEGRRYLNECLERLN